MPQFREPPPRLILVADDDTSIRELVATRLILGGYTVLTACDGRDAVKRMTERRYDGLILDLNMPNLDGFGVLTEMKGSAGRLPPTLMLTARHNSEDVRTAIKLGARDYLMKPFDEKQLMMRVARLFRVATQMATEVSAIDSLLDGPAPGPAVPAERARRAG